MLKGPFQGPIQGEKMKQLLKLSSALVGAIVVFGTGLYLAGKYGLFNQIYVMIGIIGLAAVTAAWAVDLSTSFGARASAFALEWTTLFATIAAVVTIVAFVQIILFPYGS